MLDQIPLFRTQNTIGIEVLSAIQEVLESGWLTLGPKTLEFEREFSKLAQCKYGVATNSCTAALYLALNGVGLKKKASVVVPVNTFVATANVVRMYGAEPVFCDVDEYGEIDVEKLRGLLESDDRIECIIPVHLYGFPCNIQRINELGKDFGVKIIEDCAQAHGAKFDDKSVGSFGDAGCFSFYATKNITTGEGGMLVTNNRKVKDCAFSLRNHGQNKSPKEKASHWRFDVTNLGFNFRMSEIAAVLGLKQIEKLEAIIESRVEIARRYKDELEKIDGLKMLHNPYNNGPRHGVFHLLEITVENSYPLNRDQLYLYLQNQGIITGVHYPPLHFFSYYQKTTKYRRGDFPSAEALYSKILSLPIFPFMPDDVFQRIINSLKASSK